MCEYISRTNYLVPFWTVEQATSQLRGKHTLLATLTFTPMIIPVRWKLLKTHVHTENLEIFQFVGYWCIFNGRLQMRAEVSFDHLMAAESHTNSILRTTQLQHVLIAHIFYKSKCKHFLNPATEIEQSLTLLQYNRV